MAVRNILSKLRVDKNWVSVKLIENDFYLIAIKEEKDKKRDTIDSKDISRVIFEIGIDSGIKNNPLTIQYLTVNFEDITSGNNELNGITGFIRVLNFPKTFYIRPSSVIDKTGKAYKEGEISISVNINEFDLGN